MTYKNIKFTDSPTMRSLEKLAVSKGLVKPEQIQKTASSVEIKSTLKPTDNVEENILKLCSALRSSGFSKHATEVETNFFNLKKAQAYDVHGETGEDVINFAHPDGSHQMKNVDGDAMFETIIDQQTAMKKMIAKKPTGKLASRALADMVKAAGRLEKKHAIDAVKIILAKDLINIDEDNGDTGTTSTLSSIAHQANFVLWQETVQKMEKQITPLMNLDKIPPQIKQAVNTYKQFISNISIALSTALNDASKKAKELETKRLLASGNDHAAAKINIKEILPYLSEGKVANLDLGSVATFGELKSKLSGLYSQIGDALQTKLLPAFNQSPFDSGDLKNVGDKIKQALNESIETLKKG